MKQYLKHPIFKLVSEVSDQLGFDAYVIGGFVRDLFLDRPSKDVDITVIGSGIKLAEQVAKKAGLPKPKVYRNFGTAMLQFENWEIEFVGARKESYRKNSRKPIVENGTLKDDQNRRDFTINALALSLNKSDFGRLLDPFGGVDDLKNKIIRTPLEAGITFSDDPLRMMRAVRFATQLNFQISPDTLDAIKQKAERIKIVSWERINDELFKIIESQKPSIGFNLIFETGLLNYVLPELKELHGTEYIDGKGHKDNFSHTLEVLDKLSLKTGKPWLRWAAVFHDIGKPASKKYNTETGWTFHAHDFIGARMVPKIFKRMKMPLNEKMRYVQKMVQLHLRPIALTEETVTDSAIRRLLFEAGNDIEDLMLLCEADITSKNPKKVKRFLRNFKIVRDKLIEVEEKDRIRNWEPPISGEIIMKAFEIAPGRDVGVIKNSIREAILDGEIGNDFKEAFHYMIEKGKDLNLESDKNFDDFHQDYSLWKKQLEQKSKQE